MSTVSSYVECFEVERHKQKAQIERMSQENAWLRDELAIANKRLQLSEQRCATLDEQRSHLQFLTDLKAYQPDSSAEVCRCGISTYRVRALDLNSPKFCTPS